jgi:hypothetical protein
MPKVFISHASLDVDFVDPFVDTVVRLGCGLHPAELFYSSGQDTGVPSGSDLMAHVRAQVETTDLVVAIISPTYVTRPVCVAEMGAAWGISGKFFPILVPGMPRTALTGVLSTMLIKYADQREVLDELADHIADCVGHKPKAATWGRYVEKWLKAVGGLATKVPVPDIPTPEEVSKIRDRVEELREALGEAETEVERLEEENQQISALKDKAEVDVIRLPTDQWQRLEALAQQARDALRKLDMWVAEALRADLFGNGMEWPNGYEDQFGLSEVRTLVDDGELVESYGGERLVPDYDFSDVQEARDAVGDLIKFIEKVDPEISDQFKAEYRVPLDLSKRKAWDRLLRS